MEKDTCEIRYYKYHFVLSLILNFIVLAATIINGKFGENEYTASESFLIVLIVLSLILLIYYLYQLVYYIRLKPLYIQEVKLEKLESYVFRAYLCFVVEMEIEGGKRKVRTLAIFRSVGLLAPNRVDYYSGKKALVGYDQKNDVAVVIKALKKDNKEEE
ncbi:MAG: hypothetical protein ACOX4W_03475 [Bacilli bacterium]|jgi:hypothetical protein